jgi:hypothetical protein
MPDIFDELDAAPKRDIFDELDMAPKRDIFDELDMAPPRFEGQRAPAFYPGREGEGGLYTPRVSPEFGPAPTRPDTLAGLAFSPLLNLRVQPFHPFPGEPSAGEKLLAGGLNVAQMPLEGASSPAALATLGTGALGGAASRVVSGLFAADMARQLPEQAMNVYEAFKLDEDPQAKLEALGGLGTGLLFTTAAGVHAGGPAGPRGRAVELARELDRATAPEGFVNPGDLLVPPVAEAARGDVFDQVAGPEPYRVGRGVPLVLEEGLPAEVRTAEVVPRRGEGGEGVALTVPEQPATVKLSPPAETITGANEGIASEMPAEREKRPKAAKSFSTNERPWDLLDEIEGTIGHIDPKLIREADPNWKPVGAVRAILRKGGSAADQAVQSLTYEEGGKLGVTADMAMDEFGHALNAAATARKSFRGAQERGNVETVPVNDLIAGDKFTVQGHDFKVLKLEFDENADLTGIVVKDGPKFGVQKIGSGQELIHIDKGTLKPVPREEWPAEEAFALNAPESVAEQAARLAQEQAKRDQAAQREAVAEGAAAPLVGSQGDIGQGDLLGGGDLLSGGLVAGSKVEAWADQKIAESAQRVSTGLDPEVLAAYAIKGVAHLERGFTKFTDWAQRMVSEHGPGIRRHLQQIWTEANRIWRGSDEPLLPSMESTLGTRSARRIYRAVQLQQQAEAAAAELPKAGAAARARMALAGVQEGAMELSDALRAEGGRSMPITTAADRRAGELGVRWASSAIAAEPAARAYVDEVLGGMDVDAVRFGAALTEDNLRGVKAQRIAEGDLNGAAQVKTLIGADGSPFRTEQEFQDFVARPGTQTAVARHNAAWDRVIDPMYRAAQRIDDLLPLPPRGQLGRINLLGVRDTARLAKPRRIATAQGPSLTGTFRRRSPFGRRATGASEQYGIDYGEIMHNTFAQQLAIANKNAFEARLVHTGDAYIDAPGKSIELKGEATVPVPLNRTLLVTQNGNAVSAAANLYVRRRLAGEYKRAAGVASSGLQAALGRLTAPFNQAAMAGLTDATVHLSNLATVLFARPMTTGANPIADLLLSAAGRADVPVVAVRALMKGMRNNAAQLGQLAEIGALRAEHGRNPRWWNPGTWIQWADKTTRLVLDDAFQEMARRGMVENTETARREFINQVGQYNKRLQGPLTATLRDSGVAPFVTAGKTFSLLGVRTATLAPGVKASSPGNAAMLRAAVAARWIGAAALAGTLNYLFTKDKGGGVTGRPGTPLGRVDIGLNDEAGLPLAVPVFDILGLGRALRATGVRGYVESRRLGLDNNAGIDAAGRDLVNAWTSPMIGPPLRFAFEAVSGYQPALGVPRHAPVVPPGDSQLASDAANAAYNASPVAATLRESGALGKVAPWMPYVDQLPPKPTAEVIAKQIPRLTVLPGKPAEMIERYPEIVQRAKSNAFIDDVIHRARTIGLEQRLKYLQESVEKLPATEQMHAWREIQRRRVYVMPAAAESKP